jgi:hypothetical protein
MQIERTKEFFVPSTNALMLRHRLGSRLQPWFVCLDTAPLWLEGLDGTKVPSSAEKCWTAECDETVAGQTRAELPDVHMGADKAAADGDRRVDVRMVAAKGKASS